MSNVQTTQQLGYSFDIAITKTNDEQDIYLQSVSNQRNLAELRPRFMKALQVDRKLVFANYQSHYFDNITNRDFDGSKNDFEMAEIVAIEEAIYYAEKLDNEEYEKLYIFK